MNEQEERNEMYLVGEILTPFTEDHCIYGEKFYSFTLGTNRYSGVQDQIPIIVSERYVGLFKKQVGDRIAVGGQFRSHNLEGHLKLFGFAKEVNSVEQMSQDINFIKLSGYIVKKPIYRETPYGREIADILLAVNRIYKKSDYIPCIVWGRNAKFVSKMPIGTEVTIEGRVQSRKYLKRYEDQIVEKTAYEVSGSKIFVKY